MPTQKPNLMSTARGRQEPGQRILASLEHGGKPPAPPPRTATGQLDGWIIGVGLLVAVLAVFAWAVRSSANTPAPTSAPASRQIATPATPAQSTAPSTVAQRTPDSQPAAIINEAPAPAHRPQAGMPATNGAAMATPSPALPVKAALARTAAPPVRMASTAPAPRTGAAAAAARTSAAPAAGAAGGDTDVALLTALVAHAGQPATVTPERSRDVVERHDGDSTASLLGRCKQLGLIEGMLCRSRICAGRWDSDAACRAPNH
jgi:hypothetical protein